MRLVQPLLDFLTGQILLCEVDQHQVVVSAAGNDINASLLQTFAEGGCIVLDLLHINLEGRVQSFFEADCLRCDHMLEGAALCAGEDTLVEVVLLCGLFHCKDHAASGAAQGLVGRCGNNIRIGEGTGMKAGHDKACDVGDVSHQDCAACISCFAELFEVDGSAISGCACNDHLGHYSMYRKYWPGCRVSDVRPG